MTERRPRYFQIEESLVGAQPGDFIPTHEPEVFLKVRAVCQDPETGENLLKVGPEPYLGPARALVPKEVFAQLVQSEFGETIDPWPSRHPCEPPDEGEPGDDWKCLECGRSWYAEEVEDDQGACIEWRDW
jgi:hypothetical protein